MDNEETKVISFGAGVNSTAILGLIKLKKLDLGNYKIVFSDTHGENPETYCHIEQMKKEFDITILKKKQSLYDYCIEKRVMPSRRLRWCTDKWKIQPINKWIKNNFEDYKLIMGFCAGEEKRVKNYTESEYPLIDLNIDRKKCKQIIKKASWKIPPKSGCYYCPFQRKISWIALRENKPNLFKKAVYLEKNARNRYPKMFLYGNKPLTDLETSQQRFEPLHDYRHCLCSL